MSPGVLTRMTSSKPASDDKPRLIVVVSVMLVCLGAIYLLLNSGNPKEESSDHASGVDTNYAPSHAKVTGPNQIVRTSAPYRLGPPLRSAAPESESVEAPAAIVAEQEAKTAATSSESRPSGPTLTGGVRSLPSGIEITGRVTLAGTPPPEIVIDMSSDARCAKLQKVVPATRHYLVGKERALANVFVYVKEGLHGKRFPISTNVAVVGPSNCFFEPYVSGVQANQKLSLRNTDDTIHTARITPKTGSANQALNISLPRGGQSREHLFSAAEILVQIRCDVHPWEFGYVGVVEHPFFAVTDTNGAFRLPAGLPPGRYTLEAIHLKTGTVSQEFDVRTDEKKNFDFTLRIPPSP